MENETEMEMRNQDQCLNPLFRQGSLYSLTLDEVQNQLCDSGKPLSSMNLDELLKTVLTAETNNQAMGGAGSSSSLSLNPNRNMISGDLSKRTVDQVWQDIQDGQKRSNLERKSTFGEITLEDFLVKAGVVAAPCVEAKNNMGLVPDPWMSYVHPQLQPNYVHGLGVQQPISFSDAQISMAASSPLMSTLSDTQTPGRKRVAPDDIAEKSIERRQKRMIKNRESAARSRARKQAYTQELENKVSRLEEENERLKRQKELEQELALVAAASETRYQLRRTSSAPS
ncbi:hypothetical protein M569_06001 [Genlisea aurea]|uniref:BZIP domain-containing protein n=1 Tax=Genlisea aurea TaxID=192259 RepID=S8DZJ1_9LAMI|nr:hypothetical protein M569_06001 [Genlisea aurea]